MVGSLPRGMPKVVDYRYDACDQEPDGDTRRRDSDLDRFGPSDRRNTLRPVSLVFVLIWGEICYDLYPLVR